MKLEEKEIKFYMEILPKWKKLEQERQTSFKLNCYWAPYAEFHEEEGKAVEFFCPHREKYSKEKCS